MSNIVEFDNPKNKVIDKVYKYFVFTIAISWLPIIANCFFSFILGLEYKDFILYKSEICIMTIVLVANNIKDLTESRILKRGGILKNVFYTLNFINILLSVLFFAGSNIIELLHISYSAPEFRQFIFAIGTYVAAAFMGIVVQIGGGIDEIRRSVRKG